MVSARAPLRVVLSYVGMLLVVALASATIETDRALAEIIMVDAAGRSVKLPAPAKRIVTNESLLLITLALIDDDPVGKLAGWAAPQRLDKGIYSSFQKKFPAIDKVSVVGGVIPSSSSVESILSARPDLFVVSIWEPGWREIADVLERAGVPVLFLDSAEASPKGPDEAIAASVKLLGQAIGRSEKANEYSEFVLSHYENVASRISDNATRPTVLVEAHVSEQCCSVPGLTNRLTELVTLAGGQSVGSDVVPGYSGQLSMEAVLGIDPKIYIGTGGPHLASEGGLVLGGGIDTKAARASLTNVLSRGLRPELTAVQEGRAFAVSHQLAISALNVLVLEKFAKWIRPDLAAKVDPDQTLADINQRFMAVQLEGTFWIAADDGHHKKKDHE